MANFKRSSFGQDIHALCDAARPRAELLNSLSRFGRPNSQKAFRAPCYGAQISYRTAQGLRWPRPRGRIVDRPPTKTPQL